MSWQEKIRRTLEAHRMFRFGGRVGAAVSGGADSIFLLHALAELGCAAAVLHVNHRLRSADSDADEAHVRGLAARLGLPFYRAELPPGAGNLEQEARNLRYGFFRRSIADGVCDAVATGHTLDDQAETVVSRFLRGSGTSGLRGILPVTDARMIRPLLGFRRDEIRSLLRAGAVEWREDASNDSPDFQRNQIRMEVLPRLAEVNPALPEVLASTAEWARGEEEYWEAETARLARLHFAESGGAVLLRTGPLLLEPAAVQRRLLREAFRRVRGDLRRIDFGHVEAVRTLISASEGSGRIQLPGLDVFRSFDWLRLDEPGRAAGIPRNFEAGLTVPGAVEVPGRGLALQIEPVTAEAVYNDGWNVLDGERVPGRLLLRNWQPGDTYQPKGASGPVKIKTLFQEGRVPLWERRNWPVLVEPGAVQGQGIVWSRRFGASEEFAAGEETRRILAVREVTESKR